MLGADRRGLVLDAHRGALMLEAQAYCRPPGQYPLPIAGPVPDAFLNRRQMLPGMEHSAWAAFCAVTEHIDHLPRRGATQRQKAEARFNVCLYGPGRDMKQRAFEAACRFAGLALAN